MSLQFWTRIYANFCMILMCLYWDVLVQKLWVLKLKHQKETSFQNFSFSQLKGRILLKFAEEANIVGYGCFLPYFLGNYVLFIKIYYDEDTVCSCIGRPIPLIFNISNNFLQLNPDIFKMTVSNNLKNSSIAVV